MTVDAVCGYADKVLRRTASGDDTFSYAAGYLFSMLELGAGAEPRVSMLYFVTSYTLALRGRDSTDEEALAVERLVDADAARVTSFVRAHAELGRAMRVWTAATGARGVA